MAWLKPKFAGKSKIPGEIELGVGKEHRVDNSACHIRTIANEWTLTPPTGPSIPTNRCLVLWVHSFAGYGLQIAPRAQSWRLKANSIKFFILFGLGGRQTEQYESFKVITHFPFNVRPFKPL